jgi:hypothetical protein
MSSFPEMSFFVPKKGKYSLNNAFSSNRSIWVSKYPLFYADFRIGVASSNQKLKQKYGFQKKYKSLKNLVFLTLTFDMEQLDQITKNSLIVHTIR